VIGDGTGLRRFDPDETVAYETYGGIDTAEALGDDALMRRVTDAGTRHIRGLPAEPSLSQVLARGWSFAREVGLPTDEVVETVAAVEDAGGTATMAMVGETVFAVGDDDARSALAHETAVAADGARLL
jgi:pantoate kinase